MRKGELTRSRIIELAAPLFNERGYAGCSMSDIMEATGLEKGGIYRHFESKEALALAALEFAVEETHKLRSSGLDASTDALSKLKRIIETFGSPIPGGCPYLNASVDGDDGNPAIREIARRAFQQWRTELIVVLKEGLASGQLDRSLDPTEMADTIMASLEGALVLSRVQGNRKSLRNVQSMLGQLLQSFTAPANTTHKRRSTPRIRHAPLH